MSHFDRMPSPRPPRFSKEVWDAHKESWSKQQAAEPETASDSRWDENYVAEHGEPPQPSRVGVAAVTSSVDQLTALAFGLDPIDEPGASPTAREFAEGVVARGHAEDIRRFKASPELGEEN